MSLLKSATSAKTVPVDSAGQRPRKSRGSNARSPGEKPVCVISARELAEFAFRTGNLGGERDFVSSSRALEGTRGHQRLQKSRPAGYQKEVSLRFEVAARDYLLRVQGRLDGLWQAESEAAPGAPARTIIEEIKTVEPGWRGEPDQLHWAQVKIYGAMLLKQQSAPALLLCLTYLDIDTGAVREFKQEFTCEQLEAFFATALNLYRQWLERQWAWKTRRDVAIQALEFPFSQYRPGQRRLAVAVYQAIRAGKMLFACAPTGIGKTMSVLYPAIKTLPDGWSAKVFYLTARTSGRQAAENALEKLRRAGLRLRSVTLTAKQKICFEATGACESLTCPYAIGYYDRIQPALLELLEREALSRPVVEEVARRHRVCPFELSLDAALWVDVIIADYNYVMDPRAYLRRFFAEPREAYAFLVDEAHNLVDRAREMFSAALDKAEVLALKRALNPRAETSEPATETDRALAGFALEPELAASEVKPRRRDTTGLIKALNAINKLFIELRQQASLSQANALTMAQMPETWESTLRPFLQSAETWLARNQPAPFREALIQFYFKTVGFLRIAELFDERFLALWDQEPERMRLFCVDPAGCLQKALQRGRSSVFFSATLAPLDYFKQTLGGQATEAELRLDSPFPPERFGLFVQNRIATHFRARESTFEAVAKAIETFVNARTGNYLVFFPSYQYLNQVIERARVIAPDWLIKAQVPGMTIEESDAFLASFEAQPERTQVGFAVLGGIFGEGIDLAGGRLTGAVVVGVGLPQIGWERNLIRDFFETKRGAGFEYAYVYPGMNRVLQAAGRVIRSETDRGAVLLIDARYSEARYRRLFPPWWQPRFLRDTAELAAALQQFWAAGG
jgi:DNA excision repair protein ERCC-2